MPKLPGLTADRLRLSWKAGFILARQSGSHMIYKNASGRRVAVPNAQKILHPKLLKSILRDADIKAERLTELL